MAHSIRKVGVVGAGQMGSGIAHVAALAGFDVLLHDVAAERIKSSLATINGNMARQISANKISEAERQAALARNGQAPSVEALNEADIVIESATENEAVKRQIFVALRSQLKPDAILATNTSSISITRLASSTDRPE